jgi:hypothetical protein
MHVFGLMMTSLSRKCYQFVLSQSVCSGIGASLIFTPAMTAVSTSFFPCPIRITDSKIVADDLLPQETSNCRRISNRRLLVRRCHLPNHGRSPASKSRFRLDDENLCISYPWATHHHQLDRLFIPPAQPEAIQIEPIPGAASGNKIYPDVPWQLFLVL